MKTTIGAVIGIVIIILIVVFTRTNQKTDTMPQEIDTTNTSVTDTQTPTDTVTTPAATPTPIQALEISTTKQGTGPAAVVGDTVSMNYTGTLENGTVFDSNVDPKFQHVEPFQFTLGGNMVIQGWEKGVLGMKKGEKRHLVIPASLGYGATGAGPIPGNATLIFDVELVAIVGHK